MYSYTKTFLKTFFNLETPLFFTMGFTEFIAYTYKKRCTKTLNSIFSMRFKEFATCKEWHTKTYNSILLQKSKHNKYSWIFTISYMICFCVGIVCFEVLYNEKCKQSKVMSLLHFLFHSFQWIIYSFLQKNLPILFYEKSPDFFSKRLFISCFLWVSFNSFRLLFRFVSNAL